MHKIIIAGVMLFVGLGLVYNLDKKTLEKMNSDLEALHAEASTETASVGDADTRFSIQSISKVFALALCLSIKGDELWKRVGREPSGTTFNSLIQLEVEHGIPRKKDSRFPYKV